MHPSDCYELMRFPAVVGYGFGYEIWGWGCLIWGGKVSIEVFQGRYRLRWRHDGRRYTLSLGLKESDTNKAVAVLKAAQIERDIEYSMFDVTLEKYRGEPTGRSLRVVDIFEKFLEFKRDKLYPQSLSKYKGLLSALREYFGDRLAGGLNADDCDRFRVWLANHLAPATARERLSLMVACWDWAIETRRLPLPNPWKGIARNVKHKPVASPQPFSQDEIRRILKAFREHPAYSHYADFVEFLLGSGCRVGEAIALTWGNVSPDCSQIWFGQTYSDSGVKSLKAGEPGFVPLSKQLTTLLQRRRPDDASPDVCCCNLWDLLRSPSPPFRRCENLYIGFWWLGRNHRGISAQFGDRRPQ